MASYGYTFSSGDGVTPTRLNAARTVSDIVNADIKSDAAIAGTKIAPNFGSQNVVTTGTLSSGAITAPTLTLNTGSNPLLISNALDPYIEVRDTAATTRAFVQASNGIGGVGTISNHPFRINTNSTERLRIDASGNVGIGTTSPSTILSVIESGTGNGLGGITTGTTTAGGNAGIRFVSGGTNRFSISTVGAAGLESLRFRDENNAAERMRIAASGNVGIGATSPRGLVDLNATRQVKVYFGTAGTIGETQTSAGDYMANSLFVSAESAGTMTYTKIASDAGNAIIQDVSRGVTFYTGVTGAATTTGTLNNFERVRIDTNGRVGINTSTPSYTLDVNGIINTANVLRVGGTPVVGSRVAGWAAPTGTATRTTFATSTVTTAQLAERVKALIDDLTTHGLIGS